MDFLEGIYLWSQYYTGDMDSDLFEQECVDVFEEEFKIRDFPLEYSFFVKLEYGVTDNTGSFDKGLLTFS